MAASGLFRWSWTGSVRMAQTTVWVGVIRCLGFGVIDKDVRVCGAEENRSGEGDGFL